MVGAGQVSYLNCCGVGVYIDYGATGPEVINDCMQYGTLMGVTATIEFISYSSTPCNCTTTTTTTETPSEFTTLNYGVSLSDPNQACDNFELGVLTTMYVLDSEIPIGLGDHLYSIANVANPAPAGFYARLCSLGICTYEVTGFYGEITGIAECGTLTTTTTTTLPPAPTYVQIPSYPYLYNTSNASMVGVCCEGSYLYVDGSGNFVTTPTAGYTLVEYFYVDDNGGTYFDTATVMYADALLLFPVPAGYYGSQPAGYRQVAGTAGQFSTSITSCAGVDCP